MPKTVVQRRSTSGSRAGSARPSRRRTISLLLLGFVLIGVGVIYRRTVGLGLGRDIHTLEQKHQATEAKRVQLEGEIRDASSRSRLLPIAQQRLHMHLPNPDQLIQLPRAARLAPPGPPPGGLLEPRRLP
jgi:cell division protein FtsL